MIIIKTESEIAAMRQGGKILAGIMEEIGRLAKPGANTEDLDKLAEKLVFDNGGIPVFKGFGDEGKKYPATICASINNEIVHSIPDPNKILKVGDILKIDIGMKYKNLITDMARTFEIGAVSSEAHELVKVTKEVLDAGIKKICNGAKLSEYCETIESYVRGFGFSAVRDLVGHGVGRELHEDPQIPNYKSGRREIILRTGMTLALEPMINAGDYGTVLMPDGWTFATADGKLSAHFEDTVLVKKGGCEILTRK